MVTKKAFLALASAVVVAGLVWTSATAVGPTPAHPGKARLANLEAPLAASSAACNNGGGLCCQPCNYFEDFENQAHFSTAVGVPAGNILNQGDPADVFDLWTTTCSSIASKTSLVSQANPAGGSVQHLRMSYDNTAPTSTTLGCVISARVPASAIAAVNNPPVDVNVLSVDIAINGGNQGSDFNVQPQAPGQGFLTTRTMFYYYGTLYALDDTGGGCCTFVNFGLWDTSGAYQNLTVTTDPCNNTVTYNYGNGAATYNGVGGVYAGTTVDQVLFYHDNYANLNTYDIDNVNIVRGTGCPAVCGDGVITSPEQCDGAGPGLDDLCPGRCQQDCTCAIPCGGALPGDPCQACDIVNDTPYSEISTGGWFKFVASAPAYAFDTCGITIPEGGAYDSALSVWSGDCATGLTLIEMNDDCDDNTFGYGLNADPLASCYAVGGIAAPFQSCLCVDGLTLGQTYYVSDDRADNSIGRRIDIVGSKRFSCDALWGEAGACCDTNGEGAGTCTDNVLAADCTGPGKRFTLNKSCGSAEAGECVCIPDCTGKECGDDGCGGSCGTCNDNVACTDDACNAGACVFTPNNANCDDNNVCNGVETCTANGCQNGIPQLCDDGLYCNGAETCNPLSGCTPGTPPCDPTLEICDEATDSCAPAAIPTVSEWGLAIMSLLLLVGLKVYFGRREALA